MRHARLMLMLLGMGTALLAADPFDGTWKLNAAKSTYKTGGVPKEVTIVIAEKAGELDVNITGRAEDGSPIASHYTMPVKGGAGKIIKSPYDGVSGKRLSANKREVGYMKDGKVVYTATPTLLADGKTMAAPFKGTDAAGKPVEGTAVYEKQ
jgi:hypothetical protein